MINYILIGFAVYVVTLCLLFYIDWCFYYHNDKGRSVKTVLGYMNWVEFIPIVNTFILLIMIGFFGFVFLCNYISDFVKIIKKLIFAIF